MWRYTFFASTLALASLLGALLGDYLFHYTMEALSVKTLPDMIPRAFAVDCRAPSTFKA